MAYVFDSIDQALNSGAPATQSQSDIFNATQPAANTSATGPMSGGTDVKTTTGADLNNIGASQGSGGSALPLAASNQNAAAAVAKNKAEYIGMPSDFGDAVKNINTALQNQADTYTQTQAAKGTADNLDQPTLESAVSGNTDAGSKVRSRLSEAAPVVDPYRNSVDTTIPDLASLNTQAGLSGLLSRNAGSGYTSGLSNLDSMLLGQNDNFIKERQGLNNQQTAINAKAADTDPVTAAAQAAATNNFNSGTGFINDYLGNQETSIKANAAANLARYNSGLNANKNEYIEAQRQAALNALRKASSSEPYASYIDPAVNDVNAAQYYAPAAAATDPSRFYSADDASKFNLIESLLGNTGFIQGGLAPTADQTFNSNAYEKALISEAQSQTAAQRAKDLAFAKELARPKTPNQATVDALNNGLLSPGGLSAASANSDLAPAGAVDASGNANHMTDLRPQINKLVAGYHKAEDPIHNFFSKRPF